MGLDSVELVMEVEDHFNVKLPDAECQRVRTVADLAALVIAHLPESDQACPRAQVLDEVRRLTARQMGLPLDKVRAESDFVKDLEMD